MSTESFNPHEGVQQDATPCNNKNYEQALRERFSLSIKGLTQVQLAAVELLLQGLSDNQVAAQLNVDRTTIFRWRKLPKFAQELDLHRRKLIEQSTARLQSLLDPALDILQKQLAGTDPKTALRAAAILVRLATPARLMRPVESKPPPDPFKQALDDYINAPLPDGSNIDLDDDEEEEDEEEDE